MEYLEDLDKIAKQLENSENAEERAIAGILYTILGSAELSICTELLNYIRPWIEKRVRELYSYRR